jgi:hypothetical protein
MPKISNTTANRVWIELERSRDQNLNIQRAALATNLIQRLGSKSEFYWDEEKGLYGLRREGGEFTELNDNGQWFNLEFFGRPLEQKEGVDA